MFRYIECNDAGNDRNGDSMNISGIRPSAGIYDYNIIKKETEEVQAQQISKVQTEQERHPAVSQKETAFDYAGRYEPGKQYEMKGTESVLEDLDMEKAISDMQKDQLLHQYQFFVGTSQKAVNPADTAEIYPYENFEI